MIKSETRVKTLPHRMYIHRNKVQHAGKGRFRDDGMRNKVKHAGKMMA